MNPLKALQQYGQSFWYDNIHRKYLHDGTIRRMIEEDGLRGMTSNPSIFEKAIGSGEAYDSQILQLATAGEDLTSTYEALVLEDIGAACDIYADVYESTKGMDGFVSLEVSPHLASDTKGTIAEARRLFKSVDRPNVMIKVPATAAGIPAIHQLIGEGLNINITLMFSMAHYEAVADAYIRGLEHYVNTGGDPAKVASVASFFVSRVDTAVDKQLNKIGGDETSTLLGKTAVANSKLVYQRFKDIFHGESFESLKSAGARVQRLLWASTSTKNPDYSDTLYVDELIGPETVNTMPQRTVDAFRDHGRVGNTLEKDLDEAHEILDRLRDVGVNLDQVTEQLQLDGVRAFADSYDELLETLRKKMMEIA